MFYKESTRGDIQFLTNAYDDMDKNGGLILRKSNGVDIPIRLEDDEVAI